MTSSGPVGVAAAPDEEACSNSLTRLQVLARQLTSTAENKQAIICGGTVYDVQARADVDVLTGSSVPGKVSHTPGGVARNIADCLSQLLPSSQPPPIFCTLVGNDVAGLALRSSLQQLRLDTSYVQLAGGVTTPTVIAVLDRQGELASCVADVRAVEQHLTPDGGLKALAANALPKASLLICETNLSQSSLEFLCRAAHQEGIPVILEPVSVPKSKRAVGCLPFISFITPNARELVAIAEEVCRQSCMPSVLGPVLRKGQQEAVQVSHCIPSSSSSSSSSSNSSGSNCNACSSAGSNPLEHELEELARCAALLLHQGTQHVVVTMGARGAAIMSLRAGAAQHDRGRSSCPHRDADMQGREGGQRGQAWGDGGHGRVGEAGRHGRAGAHGRPGSAQHQPVEVQCVHLPALPPQSSVVSTSGAGDTLVGGLAAALLSHGLLCGSHTRVGYASCNQGQEAAAGGHASVVLQHCPPARAVAMGMAAATLAIQSHSNVPPGLSVPALASYAHDLISSGATMRCFHYRMLNMGSRQ